MDEFDIESAPSRTRRTARDGEVGARNLDAPPPPPAASPGPAPFAPYPTPRARMLRAAGMGIALLLALALLLGAVPGARMGIAGLLALPTATPALPIPSGGDVFYWEHTVPWGRLTIDGQPGPSLVVAPTEDVATGFLMPPSLRLPRGRHILTYSAALFPTRTCVVYIPDIERDTCHEPVGIAGAIPPITGPPARVLDFGDTVDQLLPGDAAALIAATQSALAGLAGNTPLAPGEAYLGLGGATVIAAQPLHASLTFTVNTNARYAQVYSPLTVPSSCVSFCDIPTVNDLPVDAWPLFAHVVATWSYSLPTGQPVLANAPAAIHPEDAQFAIVIEARWKGAWQVIPELTGYGEPQAPPCQVGEAIFDRDSGDPLIAPTASNYHWPFEVPLPGLACLMAGGPTVDVDNSLTGAVALLIYRFGLLEAGNPLARRIFPGLPLASPADQALARQFAPPGTTP